MTQLKFSQQEKPKIKDTDAINGKPLTFRKEKHIRALPWILLTIGLCIIVTTFYLAIYKAPDYTDNVENTERTSNDNNDMGIYLTSVVSDNLGDNEVGGDSDNHMGIHLASVPSDNPHDDQFGGDLRKNARITLEKVYGVLGKNFSGCQEKLCDVACSKVENVYLSLYETMKLSSCPSIDVLIFDRQDFPWGIVKNLWLHSNISVHEVILRFSSINRIKDNAFNSHMFRNTIVMSWSHLNIVTVESGALLGLYKLKYLSVECRVRQMKPALFQPVQNTLTHLKFNANMKIYGNRNFFGASHMNNLEYLDMSRNQFNCTLTKKFFDSTPNLKYLIIEDSRITHIEKNTFNNLAHKLLFINLSKNLLTTLAAEVIRPILLVQKTAMISLCTNGWNCNCELQELAELYKMHRIQFMEAVYCKSPHELYSISIDEVNFENCNIVSSTVQETVDEKEVSTATYTTTNSSISGEIENSSEILHSGEFTTRETSPIFKMRCLDTEAIMSASLSSSSSESDNIEPNLNSIAQNEVEYLAFPAPEHEFELQLIPENNSVIVSVKTLGSLYIIWFSEQNTYESSYKSMPFDYKCMGYSGPSMIVGPLEENCTYTFCLIPSDENDITPFNCLPLHVPLTQQENIWISEDNKQFTIGMLCLIFLLSTIAGAVIAYFGIKAYPDLLEGSKNVLIVKKSDQACYVSTISETEYQKQSSLKKKKLSNKKESQLKQQTSIKAPLPATPCLETPPPPFHISVKDLERLSSLKSSSTCFEDTFSVYSFQDDEYETPKVCDNEYTIDQRSVPNKYGMSPRSPPPLPKRNSNISDSSTLVMNRFSNKSD